MRFNQLNVNYIALYGVDMRIKERELFETLIMDGLQIGITRAFKYTDTPSTECLMQNAAHDIWLQLDRMITWEEEYERE